MQGGEKSYSIVTKVVGGRDVRFLIVNHVLYSLDEPIDRLDDEAIRSSIAPSPEFWDAGNARPLRQTPKGVDYPCSRALPILNQGGRATCVAFALVAAMELAAARLGRRWRLSQEFASWLFNIGRSPEERKKEGVSLLRGVQMLARYGTCPSELCEYGKGPPTECAVEAATYGISSYVLIDRLSSPCIRYSGCTDEPSIDGPSITNTSYLECILSSGREIVVTMATNAALSIDGILDIEYAAPIPGYFCTPQPALTSHAMVIVGYDRVAATPYFVLRDSNQSDPDLHRLYSYDFVRRYARYGVVITDVSDEQPSLDCEPVR